MTEPHPPATAFTRFPDKAVPDRAELDRLLEDVYLAHVAVDTPGGVVAMPTAIARDGDRVIIHGSTGSRWMRSLAAGARTSVTVTALDAIVVARSSFENSFHYRSAVLFGAFTPLEGVAKVAAVDTLVDRIVPGRSLEVRTPTKRELAATLVLALQIETWTLKVSDRWPTDLAEDVAGDAWAGILPLEATVGEPVPAPDLRTGVPLPASVHALTRPVGRPLRNRRRR